MSYDPDDTITAIATATGGAARGMIRVSGPATAEVVAKCFAADDGGPTDTLRRATAVPGQFQVQLDDSSPQALPCDLFYWPTDRSYTRQTTAEFHTLGSPPLLRAVLETVCSAGARLAEPGEFTLRAFLAGRIDLTQAEAVLGVIDAQHPDQLEAAIEQLAGNLAQPLHRLRDELLSLLAELEAGLDFVEEDIEFISAAQLTARLQAAAAEIGALAEQMSSRLAGAPSWRIVLIGAPNVGKSSLYNRLVERFSVSERPTASAIVSHQHGTTRDYLTSMIELGGNRCELVDTAGIERDPTHESGISAAAQHLATEQRERALVRALCIDAAAPDVENLRRTADALQADLIVFTKADLAPDRIGYLATSPHGLPVAITSSVTGQGLDDLCRMIAGHLSLAGAAVRGRCVAATADRCRDSLRLADAAVARAAEIAHTRGGDELVAAEIRVALAELGKVAGAVYTDDLLDRIFQTFCIGK